MRKAQVVIGGRYVALVSRKLTVVRIRRPAVYGPGWEAVNETTGRAVRIRSAAKLREEVSR